MSNSIILKILLGLFKHILVIDFEFKQPLGNSPMLVCMVVKDIVTQTTKKFWLVGKKKIKFPFPIDESLFVGHYLIAEVNCMLQLQLKKPKNLFDTWVENKKIYNGKIKTGYGLVDCLSRYGIDYPLDKDKWRDVILGKKADRDKMFLPAYSAADQEGILDYCLTDVTTNEQLFYKQLDHIERFKNIKTKADAMKAITQALFSGRALAVCAQIETNGIPIDEELYFDIEKHFDSLKTATINEANKKYDLYVDGVLKKEKFAKFLKRLKLHNRWPKTPTGKYKEDQKTFDRFRNFVPEIDDLKGLTFIIGARKLNGYAVGVDNRSRAALKMYGQTTGRTNVSTAISPYGAPRYMRTIMHPDANKILVSADYKSQEPFIQAYMSDDKTMKAALATRDVYLATAKLVKAVPEHATEESHPTERQIYKTSFLAINYGQEARGLAIKLGTPFYEAATIHKSIVDAYPTYHAWSEKWILKGMQRGYFKTMYGWNRHLTFKEKVNPRSLKNWPIQSHGSEMIRHAMIAADDAGFEISMCVHDALVVHMDKKGSDKKIKLLVKLMGDASEKIINFRVPVDVKVIEKHYFQKSPDKEKWEALYNRHLKNKKLMVLQNPTPSRNKRCMNTVTTRNAHSTSVTSTLILNTNTTSRGLPRD